ncbi:MAG: glycosyltransferase family 4 protein [Legionellales bacterium]|nr:glycosyltransferase family 4 protein [Legionellales bacterium]
MKILLVSQYFWPESFIINDLVMCLAEEGHHVEVLTGKPNYPDGVVFEGYQAMDRCSEFFIEKIPVHRVPLLPRGQGGIRLFMNYLSFVVSGLLFFHRFVKKKTFDVIFVFSASPVTSVIPAMFLKKRLKLPLVIWVQDLWPESLQATGFVASRFIMHMTGRLVRWIYAACDLLLMQSEAFEQPMSRYVSANKLLYYPNSFLEPVVDLDREPYLPEHLKEALSQEDCFVFAGNIGSAQSVETLVEAARSLQQLPKCKIILVGSGSMLPWVEEQISKSRLSHLMCVGRLPRSAMPYIFSRAAGLLVTLKRCDIFAQTIPSKIQAYLAAGRPIVGALDGEGARIILQAGAGLISPAENGAALAENIARIVQLSESERDAFGHRGYAYFLKHFEMREQSQQLIKILSSVVNRGKA